MQKSAHTLWQSHEMRNVRYHLFALLLSVGMLAVLSPAPVGASTDDDVGDALETQMVLLTDGQTGRAFDLIHPAQQKVIDRDGYIKCAAERASGLELKGFLVLDVYRERIRIPGTDVKANSYAVTAKYTISNGLAERTDTNTFHEFKTKKGWRFTVPDPESAADC